MSIAYVTSATAIAVTTHGQAVLGPCWRIYARCGHLLGSVRGGIRTSCSITVRCVFASV